MRKGRVVLALLILVLVSAFTWHQSIQRAPEGQPPLVTLDHDSLATLRAEFNRDADRVRIVVLLAPT